MGVQGRGDAASGESTGGVSGAEHGGGAEESVSALALQPVHHQLRAAGGEAWRAGVGAIPGRRPKLATVPQEPAHQRAHLAAQELLLLQNHAHV